MCGLSGIAGTIDSGFTAGHHEVFNDLLYLMALRGQDSTGVGAVPRFITEQNEPTYLKILGGPWDMLQHGKYEKLMKGYFRCLLGHNRSSTVGATNLKNAHPFMHSGPYSACILGMHNGTIQDSSKRKMHNGADYGTDSEAIIANIAYEGPEATIPKLEGAYTLVWYDATHNTLNMIRNEKRPLAFVLAKNNRALFFGSESALLSAALRRNSIVTNDYFILPTDILHSWVIPPYDKEFDAPVETKIEGYKPLFTVTSGKQIEWKLHNGKYEKCVDGVFTGETMGSGSSSSKTHPTQTSGMNGTAPDQKSMKTESRKQLSAFRGISEEPRFKGFADYGEHNGYHVFFDRVEERWVEAVKDKDGELYTYMASRNAPKYLPFTDLDINGNHAFRHVGKKKKKQIFFKGWLDKLLTREDTELHFSFKCSSCQRIPKWGNWVLWLNEKHDFLCEFCAESAALVKSWKEVA